MVMKLTKQRIVNAASYKKQKKIIIIVRKSRITNYFNSFPKNEGVELFKRDT